MRMSASNPDAINYTLVDLEKKKEIKMAIEADDETGKYTIVLIKDGMIIRDFNGIIKTEEKEGKIKIVLIDDLNKYIEG